jgi:uncharacterized protein
MGEQVPLIDYLVLGSAPHLVARECTSCHARYFGRRNACANCFEDEFCSVELPTSGVVRSFTIVSQAAPGIPTPFVAAIIDLDGTSVRANLLNVEPDDEHVRLGMEVRLVTYSLGLDSNGVEAVGFAFEPVSPAPDQPEVRRSKESV